MTPAGSDPRARQALLTLEQDRQQLRKAFGPTAAADPDAFPRSATLRWIAAHLSARSLASTAAAAALARAPVRRLLGRFLFGRAA